MVRTLVFAIALVLGGHAQTPPVLTEVQGLRLENIQLKEQIIILQRRNSDLIAEIGQLHQRLGPAQETAGASQLKTDLESLKAEIEKSNPGWLWDPAKRTFSKK